MNADEQFLKMAIEVARRGIDLGQSPFGACIARRGDVLACTHNRVWQNTDITAHAEVQAIREACGKQGAVHLDDATIYSTTEPCPMCFAAIHWARIGRIVYGATVEDAQAFGFNELPIGNEAMKGMSGSAIEIVPGCLREEAVGLFRAWQAKSGKPY